MTKRALITLSALLVAAYALGCGLFSVVAFFNHENLLRVTGPAIEALGFSVMSLALFFIRTRVPKTPLFKAPT